ncbi:MAG: UDP-3-O-[3-hydroxymyristoyl] glucosamine N-acyltransferase, partial [Saprospiraceae bacterium]
MKFPLPISITAIAGKYHCEIIGDASISATGINEIHKVESGDITFVDVEKYFNKSLSSAASIILLNKRTECPEGKVLLLCEHPFEVYDALVRAYRPFDPMSRMISDSAIIHDSSILEPNVIVGNHVRIGKASYIHANVTIQDYSIIGDHVEIDSGTVIGSDAFYFKKNDADYKKWRSGGRVIIEDHVYIGANCTINKGVSGDTIIGEGTKIDCLTHIGHGVEIGKRCLIAAMVGISGKAMIEDEVIIYGQAGVAQGVRIGKKAIIGGQCGVTKSVEGGK